MKPNIQKIRINWEDENAASSKVRKEHRKRKTFRIHAGERDQRSHMEKSQKAAASDGDNQRKNNEGWQFKQSQKVQV